MSKLDDNDDVRSFYDKKFIYAFDLQGKDVTLTIARVVRGELTNRQGKEKKPIVYFEGTEKGLGLNATNRETIASIVGGYNVKDWVGKRITLYPTTTQFGKQTVECIRVRPTAPPPAKPKAQREPGEDG
jgi:hypothetical protein